MMLQPHGSVAYNLILAARTVAQMPVGVVSGNIERFDAVSATTNGAGDTVLDVLLNGVSLWAGDLSARPKILSGQHTVHVTGLSVPVVIGDVLEIRAATVPSGGIGGTLAFVVGIDDGEEGGGGGSGLPDGGTMGQLLVKASDDDGDAIWADLATLLAGFGPPLDKPYVGDIADGQVWMYIGADDNYQPRTIAPTVISGEAEQDISWAGLTVSASVDAFNTLKTSTGWGGSIHQGAQVVQTLNGVGGYISFKVGPTSESTRYLGLRNSPPDHVAGNFKFYFQLRGDGTFEVWENPGSGLTNVVTAVAYANNDVFRFEAYDDAGTPKVRIMQNGVLRATFTIIPIFPLTIDLELPFADATIREGKIRKAA